MMLISQKMFYILLKIKKMFKVVNKPQHNIYMQQIMLRIFFVNNLTSLLTSIDLVQHYI